MKTKLYISYILVAVISVLVGAGWTGSLLLSLVAAVFIAAMVGLYMTDALHSILGRITAAIRGLGDNDAPPVELKEDESLGAISSALEEADDRFQQIVATLTADKQTRDLILDNMRDGVFLADSTTEVLLANPAARRIFRLEMGELVGRKIVHAVPSQELDDLVKSVIATGIEAEADFDTFMPRERHVRAVALPVGDEQGLMGALVVIHDITGKQRIEAVRRDFVANVSHELKTPVSGITLLADSIITALESDSQAARAFANKLKRETDRLAQLVRDLLDLSQLEGEKMRPVSTQIALSEIVRKVAMNLTESAASGGISLRTELASNLPNISGSEEQLELMARNLVDNAIKYTPKGGDILLTTGVADGFASLVIKDTGIGIPQGDRKRIFERFYRVDKNRSRETGGTGLGLSIVKHVVENHSGRIAVESTVGLGSKFTVFLPLN